MHKPSDTHFTGRVEDLKGHISTEGILTNAEKVVISQGSIDSCYAGKILPDRFLVTPTGVVQSLKVVEYLL